MHTVFTNGILKKIKENGPGLPASEELPGLCLGEPPLSLQRPYRLAPDSLFACSPSLRTLSPARGPSPSCGLQLLAFL